MKRFATIPLLAMLLFNCIGYRFLCLTMEIRATKMLDARLDEHLYSTVELIGFKVPLQKLSYYNSSSRFERRTGSVNIAGVQYQYVESRIFGDSLELHCVPNQLAMTWADRKADFFARANGLQHPGTGDSRPTVPLQDRNDEYYFPPSPFVISDPGGDLTAKTGFYFTPGSDISGDSPDRPPQS